MNATDGYKKYNKSNLQYCGEYSVLKDISRVSQEKKIYIGQFADDIKRDWAEEILEEANDIAKKAVEASKKNQFSLIYETNRGNLFDVFARTLYQLHGIKVKKVHDLANPKSIFLTWNRDNGHLNPASNFLQICKQNKNLIDFNLRIKGLTQTFPCHKLVMAWKSPFFEEKLKNSDINSYEFKEGTLPETVESLLDYIYEEKRKNLSSEVIGQLLEQTELLGLKQLKTILKQQI